MSRSSAATFGDLLRQYRLAAGLTQEGLADRAGLSVHGVQKLERGATHPYRDTAQRLEHALQLKPDEGALFLAAVRPLRRHGTVSPPPADGAGHHNLPIPSTTFVARHGEIERVIQRVQEARLLTITGSGGCGKTRLAVEVARKLVSEFADGVWLINLAPLADASLVAQTIANTMGLHETPGCPPLDTLIEHLRSRPVLLLLDNCEHVVGAVAQVVDALLRVCANVRVLATSRELLGVDGEATWRVSSLSVIDPEVRAAGGAGLAAKVLATEAGRLFADRAQLVVPSFAITDHNALAVAQICQRLDGIPLAIELAAARLTTLGLDQIVARLDQRFRLLTGGIRTAVRRQQTLEATIDWSYELLSERERTLVRRLSVFAGGWSLEAAEALGGDPALLGEDVLDLLSRLVAKSMVLVEEPRQKEASIFRYRFLETIREYAEQKLLEAGEADKVRTRHRDWYLSLTEQAADGMEGADQRQWWDRLELEHDNLRAALAWSASNPGGAPQLLRLAASLGRFWQSRGYAREAIGWLETALARNEPRPSSVRARALNWRGQLETDATGNHNSARAILEESVAQARAVADERVLSIALRHLAMTADSSEARRDARRFILEALAVSRKLGRKREIAWNLCVLAENLASAGEHEPAEPLLEESVVHGRESGDLTAVLRAMCTLGLVYGIRGEFGRARRIVEEALEFAREIDMKVMIAGVLMTLGDLSSAESDWEGAERRYREALQAATGISARGRMATTARRYARIYSARGDHRRAVRLLSASPSFSDIWLLPMLFDQTATERTVIATARSALGDAEFARAITAGQSLTLEQAVAEVLAPDAGPS
jgi:predicted ATPase/DNA-binding XRE family transcriptional regulator